MNAAARLQTAAEPGEVLVGETPHALDRDSVSFGERRDGRGEGLRRARSWRIRSRGSRTRSVRRTIPFVGRGERSSRSCATASRVSSPRDARCSSRSSGESGIGKSRLADEFVAGLGRADQVLSGRSHLATDSTTFAPAASMVRDVAGIDHDDPREKTLQRLRELVEREGRGERRPAGGRTPNERSTASPSLLGLSRAAPRRVRRTCRTCRRESSRWWRGSASQGPGGAAVRGRARRCARRCWTSSSGSRSRDAPGPGPVAGPRRRRARAARTSGPAGGRAP